MKGPFPIVCRAHSGGRLLAEIYTKNNIQMGKLMKDTFDSGFFGVRGNQNIRQVIEDSFDYLNLEEEKKIQNQNLISEAVNNFIDLQIEDLNKPFGWKFGETIFTLPALFDSIPSTKAIHLIRDGRDVMLSRIPARFNPENFDELFNKLIVFGNNHTTHYKNELLNKESIEKYRTELELLHWKTVIEFGKKLRHYTNNYLEVRYEDLCTDPEYTIDKISDFIKIKFNSESREWAKKNASTERIGKWKKEDQNYINSIIQNHSYLLKEYNYL